MQKSLHLYGAPASRTGRCLWTLEEVGAEYSYTKLDFRKGEHKAADFVALNPNAKIPVLVDEEADLVLFESAAICQYIARKFPDAELLPSAPRELALHDQWMYWIVSELEQPLWSMGKHRFALPAQYRVPAMLDTALFEWHQAAPVISAALDQSEYLVGDRMRLVDILLAHTLMWARMFRVPFGFASMERYLDAMLARPAAAALKR